MRNFGFSTGALAKGDVKRALRISEQFQAQAVEYSALRLKELDFLLHFLRTNGFGRYAFVSLHAPSDLGKEREELVADRLWNLTAESETPIVIHPDAISDFDLWRRFGPLLCIENMDHRKPIGRTAAELARIFERLPKARLCFDIGHAHEIDRSMSCAYEILKQFGDRISHVHASEVSDDCAHRGFSSASRYAFADIVDLIPVEAPIILETVTPEAEVGQQLEIAREVFGGMPRGQRARARWLSRSIAA